MQTLVLVALAMNPRIALVRLWLGIAVVVGSLVIARETNPRHDGADASVPEGNVTVVEDRDPEASTSRPGANW